MKLSEFTRLLQRVIAEQDYELTSSRLNIDKSGEIIVVEDKKLVVYPTSKNEPRFEYK